MKIVINSCFGGFGLSPKGLKALMKKKGRECYFFEQKIKNGRISDEYTPADIARKNSLFIHAFDIPEPTEESTRGHYISSSDIPRDDADLIAVVEELSAEASGQCSALKIIEIPDGVEWEIEEYDGQEWVSEKHRTWN
jgi:hypothetical protein